MKIIYEMLRVDCRDFISQLINIDDTILIIFLIGIVLFFLINIVNNSYYSSSSKTYLRK